MNRMNPNIFNLLKSGGNPQQILSNMLKWNNNPMAQNIISMMNNNDSKGIEQLARNLCRSKGIDPDQMMNDIQNRFK